MQSPRLAGRYAKSIVDLAKEQDQLEAVYRDMQFLKSVCQSSRDFVNLLRSPVIKADKKGKIINAVIEGRVGAITIGFCRLLISKGRESNLPEIITAFIDQYNFLKEVHKVKLTTAEPVSGTLQAAIISKIKKETALKEIELESVTKPELIGGFVLEFDNNLVDASIARDLRDIKKQFQENIYVHKLR
jgi:F-type H+-transporting ATPase subunit delta